MVLCIIGVDIYIMYIKSMLLQWLAPLGVDVSSYKLLDYIPYPMLLQHEYHLLSEGFVRRGGTTIMWSRTPCPDCACELFYDDRFRTLSFPPQVKAKCMKGHTWMMDTPIPAEPGPFNYA